MQQMQQNHWFLNPYNVANWPDVNNFRNVADTSVYQSTLIEHPIIVLLGHRRNLVLEKTILHPDNMLAAQRNLVFVISELVSCYDQRRPSAYYDNFYVPIEIEDSNVRIFEFDTINNFLKNNSIMSATVYMYEHGISCSIKQHYSSKLNIYSIPFIYDFRQRDNIFALLSKPLLLLQHSLIKFKIACLNGKMHYFREQTTNHCDPSTTYVTWETWFSEFNTTHANRNIADTETAYATAYGQSAVALVNESRFFQPLAVFTEKALVAMIFKKPVLLASAPRSLEYLRKLGFKTWGALWDESYDLIEDHETRLQAIKDIIDYIQSKTVNELIEMSASIQDVLDHNYNRIQEIKANPMLLKLEN